VVETEALSILDMRQLELFIEKHAEKLYRNLLALEGKTGRLVTGLLTAHCSLKMHINTMYGPFRKHHVQKMWTG
jgi:hypothetical protein